MKNSQYIEIDLIKLAKALLKRVWLIILVAVLGGGTAFFAATRLISPTYEAEALMYVNNTSFSVGSTSFSISSGDLSAAQSLVDTYIVILKSRSTLTEVIKKTGVNYTYTELKNMITSEAVSGTEIFRIKVTSTNREETELLANTIAKTLPKRIAEVVDGSSVRIVDYAIVPSSKSGPDVTKITATGLLFGFVLACGIIVILELTDNVIRDEEYLLKTFENIPVLAVIPDLSSTTSSKNYYYSRDNSADKKVN